MVTDADVLDMLRDRPDCNCVDAGCDDELRWLAQRAYDRAFEASAMLCEAMIPDGEPLTGDQKIAARTLASAAKILRTQKEQP